MERSTRLLNAFDHADRNDQCGHEHLERKVHGIENI